MVLELKKQLIYGPVRSRRLKWSMGINLLPFRSKVCTFNCLYCQYGLTPALSNIDARLQTFPPVQNVLDAVEEAVQTISPPPLYLTFSGNGEPTLHPNFLSIVAGVKNIRDRWVPEAKISVLSNSTTLSSHSVRQAINQLDHPILKLDAGTEEMFRHYNGVSKGINFQDTIDHLAALSNVTIQTLFTKGKEGNSDPLHVQKWLEQIIKISPCSVQIYTLSRPTPTQSLLPLQEKELSNIQTMLKNAQIHADIFV